MEIYLISGDRLVAFCIWHFASKCLFTAWLILRAMFEQIEFLSVYNAMWA